MIGPKQVAKPKTLTTMPKCSGRSGRGMMMPVMPEAPFMAASLPHPAIAPPTMNRVDLGAAAHRFDPAVGSCASAKRIEAAMFPKVEREMHL